MGFSDMQTDSNQLHILLHSIVMYSAVHTVKWCY